MTFVSEYKDLDFEKTNSGFVGMNSGKGFICCYNDIFCESELKKLYVIKGAPGTGKSTFMKRLASKSESIGLITNRYLCSSDPTSIDGVALGSGIVVIDGTLPHSYELKYPGAISEIIDYTKFWDNNKLERFRSEIIYQSNQKSNYYAETYFRLKCEMNIIKERLNSIVKLINYEKMNAQIKRLVASFGKADGQGNSKLNVKRSVGMKGRVKICENYNSFTKVINISDVYGTAYLYMAELEKKLISNKFDIIISVDTVYPELICDIIVPQLNCIITTDDAVNSNYTINMSRFVDATSLSEIRGFLRLSKKCETMFANETDYYLSLVENAHFKLEEIYGSTMNFDFLENYSEMKINEIINYAAT